MKTPVKALILALLALSNTAPFEEAVPGYRYVFPRDHFDHRNFQTEWWYYTGNVKTAAGHRYGFELVFFRQGQAPKTPPDRSAWRADQVWLAHLALTDIDARKFHYTHRLNRSGPGVAGVSQETQRIWNGNWSAQWSGEEQTLTALADDVKFELRLKPLKPLVIHGENGVSQKAEGAGRASHYVSFPRLSVNGQLNGEAVTGTAWMDHEWFTHQLAAGQLGWDWFSVQLDDGRDLMLFQLRRKDGSIDRFSSGTLIARDGSARHLRAADFTLEPLERWKKYPVRWRVRVPSAALDLDCRATLENQELRSQGAGPTYWEGAVTYRGSATGVGYLEMTGYEAGVESLVK